MTKAEEAAANAATGQSMDGRISGSRAPFAVQSIAGEAGKARRGAAMDRRACEAVHGRTVRATPPRREARGILRRGMRCKTPRSVPSLLPTFWHCQKWVARRRRVEAFLPPLSPFGHPLPRRGEGTSEIPARREASEIWCSQKVARRMRAEHSMRGNQEHPSPGASRHPLPQGVRGNSKLRGFTRPAVK